MIASRSGQFYIFNVVCMNNLSLFWQPCFKLLGIQFKSMLSSGSSYNLAFLRFLSQVWLIDWSSILINVNLYLDKSVCVWRGTVATEEEAWSEEDHQLSKVERKEGNDHLGTCTLVLAILYFGTLAVAVLQGKHFKGNKWIDMASTFCLLCVVSVPRNWNYRTTLEIDKVHYWTCSLSLNSGWV